MAHIPTRPAAREAYWRQYLADASNDPDTYEAERALDEDADAYAERCQD